MYIEICQGGAGGLYLLSPPPPGPLGTKFFILNPHCPPHIRCIIAYALLFYYANWISET